MENHPLASDLFRNKEAKMKMGKAYSGKTEAIEKLFFYVNRKEKK